MPDLMDVLRNLPQAVTPSPAGPEVVAADVARGHHAVTRRRRQRITLSGAAVAVVAAVAVGAVQMGQQSSGPVTAAGGDSATVQSTRLQLVAYTGEQPKGFKVNTVPDGWQVISDDASAFVVAPPGQDVSQPKPGHAFSVADRIAVSLQGLTSFDKNQQVKNVDINGEEGQIGFARESEGKDSDTRWLMFPDASGRRVLIQIPASVNLTDDQLVSFARGISVTDQAQEIGG
jgi:hypothetical protein